jgi:hypothetical protein
MALSGLKCVAGSFLPWLPPSKPTAPPRCDHPSDKFEGGYVSARAQELRVPAIVLTMTILLVTLSAHAQLPQFPNALNDTGSAPYTTYEGVREKIDVAERKCEPFYSPLEASRASRIRS